ncbi:MAG: hypothetical protein VB949_03095, partial [Pseudomonadales bacterium]
MGGRFYRVDGDLNGTVGAVLESDWARQARGELAMHLTFSGAGADRAPTDQIADIFLTPCKATRKTKHTVLTPPFSTRGKPDTMSDTAARHCFRGKIIKTKQVGGSQGQE